jgi:hypothetical protein
MKHKEYLCKLSKTKLCKFGGVKDFSYGYYFGTSAYCYKIKKWIHDLDECPLGMCHADSDGDCDWKNCPQLRDGEPRKSGRHCPLDTAETESEE